MLSMKLNEPGKGLRLNLALVSAKLGEFTLTELFRSDDKGRRELALVVLGESAPVLLVLKLVKSSF